MIGWVVLGVIAAVLAVYTIIIYNGLVRLKHAVAQAWSNIDVLLRQRHDELPKLVETCRQYMQFESETLEKVTQARAAADSARQLKMDRGPRHSAVQWTAGPRSMDSGPWTAISL